MVPPLGVHAPFHKQIGDGLLLCKQHSMIRMLVCQTNNMPVYPLLFVHVLTDLSSFFTDTYVAILAIHVVLFVVALFGIRVDHLFVPHY